MCCGILHLTPKATDISQTEGARSTWPGPLGGSTKGRCCPACTQPAAAQPVPSALCTSLFEQADFQMNLARFWRRVEGTRSLSRAGVLLIRTRKSRRANTAGGEGRKGQRVQPAFRCERWVQGFRWLSCYTLWFHFNRFSPEPSRFSLVKTMKTKAFLALSRTQRGKPVLSFVYEFFTQPGLPGIGRLPHFSQSMFVEFLHFLSS